MSSPQKDETKIHQILWRLDTFKDINHRIDILQKDYFSPVYTQEMFELQVLAKIAISNFFELDMLIKRNKYQLSTYNDFGLIVVRAEKGCRFEELVKTILDLKISNDQKKQLLVQNVREHVMRRLVGLYTCYNINEISKILALGRPEAEKFVQKLGYKQEDDWVILEVVTTRQENSLREKDALRNKIFELTKLTQILQKSSK